MFNLLPDNAIKICILPNCASHWFVRDRNTDDILLRFNLNDATNEYNNYNKYEIILGKHLNYTRLIFHDMVVIIIYHVSETISPLIRNRFK